METEQTVVDLQQVVLRGPSQGFCFSLYCRPVVQFQCEHIRSEIRTV